MMETNQLQERTREVLHEIRFPLHHCGYRQLCEAIPMYARNSEISMTKELYPYLSAAFGRDAESNIRRVILYTWKHGSKEAWNRYFPNCQKPPSNLVFISTIAEYIK